MILAIIPARGGSKGVMRKNMQHVGGKSLVGRAVECCLRTRYIDRVIVSTDDDEIARESKWYGAETIMRPPELATDTANVVDAVVHAVAGIPAETLVLVEPTNPLRTPGNLDDAIELYQRLEFGSVIGVCPLERKPAWIFVKDGPTITRFNPSVMFERRQDMVHLCRLSNVVYVLSRENFLSSRSFVIDPIGFIENSQKESWNIDTPMDLIVARCLDEY